MDRAFGRRDAHVLDGRILAPGLPFVVRRRVDGQIGCQPIEYDLAGAIVEFGLDRELSARLLARFALAGGPRVDQSGMPFFRMAYAAFQSGLWSLAPASAAVVTQRRRYARAPA